MDQTKKTMRHFYCRDVLWETFEAMANDFDCSIDYLVNEAMRLYARSKNYQVPGAASPSQIMSGTTPGGPLRGTTPGARLATTPALPAARPPPGAHLASGRSTLPTPPAMPIQSGPTPPSPVALAPSNWSPLATPPSSSSSSEPPAPPLFLVFNGQRYLIDKDQFVIGRGSKTADLAIKDGNISRKHAVVLRRNGVYYIKDLGSTNGIEYKGMRIDNKRIDEGDAFTICDYELRFTYLP